MTPLEFLQEEYANVDRALRETLRREYAHSQNHDFYSECAERLSRVGSSIKSIRAGELRKIASNLTDLNKIAAWISLNERSYLGEFSWPFAQELRDLVNTLLSGIHLDQSTQTPIIQIVSESNYLILNEEPSPSGVAGRRFAVIQFPRSLKYHVLLHAIFGHELGHAAWESSKTGKTLEIVLPPVLFDSGPLSSSIAMDTWLRSQDAPELLKKSVDAVRSKFDPSKGEFFFEDKFISKWRVEFISDLCGLLLFGPAFAAAFMALVRPKHPDPLFTNLTNSTHPPFACRCAVIHQAMKILGWNKAITPNALDPKIENAERDFLVYLLGSSWPSWSRVFTDDQVQKAIEAIQSVFGANLYSPPSADRLKQLVDRLADVTPPVVANVQPDGSMDLEKVPFTQMLYAGWVFWIGRNRFSLLEAPKFFDVNRLCNHAMIQQQAINKFV